MMKSRWVLLFFLVGPAFTQTAQQTFQHDGMSQQKYAPYPPPTKSVLTAIPKQPRPTRKSFENLFSKTVTAEHIEKQLDKQDEITDNSALKESTEQAIQPKDTKEDFIHFVQSAIRRSQKSQSPRSDVRRAPIIIKKLISITPRLKNNTSINQSSPEKKTVVLDMDLQQQEETVPDSTLPGNKFTYQKNLRKASEKKFDYTKKSINDAHRSQKVKPSLFLNSYNQQSEETPVFNPFRHKYYSGDGNIVDRQETGISAPNYQVPPQRSVISEIPERMIVQKEFDGTKFRQQAENAKYSFASDVRDDINGNLHQRQETRDGTKVSGSYTYEDGFFRRTVHYVADEEGYRVVKQEVNEIGDGPLYNPDGSVNFHAFIAGQNVDYRITNKEIRRKPLLHYQKPMSYFDNHWDY